MSIQTKNIRPVIKQSVTVQYKTTEISSSALLNAAALYCLFLSELPSRTSSRADLLGFTFLAFSFFPIHVFSRLHAVD